MSADRKYQTIQARLGFEDPELTTPKHDEIMLWLDEHVLETTGPRSQKWGRDLGQPSLDRAIKELGVLPPPEDPEPKLIQKTWECPVKSGQYVVGFLDMLVEIECTDIDLGLSVEKWETRRRKRLLGLEVKPQIRSLGEVVRQIRLYESFLPIPYFVCSPDNRFRVQLESQSIGFIEYPWR